MLGRLILLFTLVPAIELALLIWVGRQIGVMATLALIVITGVLGASLARSQGLATYSRVQKALAAGRMPGRELLEGLLILIAGAVLLTPGLLTDATGFALLVPPLRRAVARRLAARWKGGLVATVGTTPGASAPRPGRVGAGAADPGFRPARGDVIDADFDVVSEEPPRPP